MKIERTMAIEKIIEKGMNKLYEMDVEAGAMDADYSPFNHLLSAEENKEVWNYLSKMYVMNTLSIAKRNNLPINMWELVYTVENFYPGWEKFLYEIERVAKGYSKVPGLERIINNSGISVETFIKFLD